MSKSVDRPLVFNTFFTRYWQGNKLPDVPELAGPDVGLWGLTEVAGLVAEWNQRAKQMDQDPEAQKKRWEDPQERELAVRIFREEAEELAQAALDNNPVLILDGLADVIFTALGIAVKSGLQDKVALGFFEALASNNTKFAGQVVDPGGKVKKGPFFRQPRFDLIIDNM